MSVSFLLCQNSPKVWAYSRRQQINCYPAIAFREVFKLLLTPDHNKEEASFQRIKQCAHCKGNYRNRNQPLCHKIKDYKKYQKKKIQNFSKINCSNPLRLYRYSIIFRLFLLTAGAICSSSCNSADGLSIIRFPVAAEQIGS